MLLYRCLITLFAPVLLVALFLRLLRKQERLQDFAERIGIWQRLPAGDVIWVHGASNGELTAARPMLDRLAALQGTPVLLITCNSVTAKRMVQAWGIPNIHARLAPIDLHWIYRRLMVRLNLQKFILIEADFWPNRLQAAHGLGVPTALIGGRISQKSARMWRRFPRLSQKMFEAFDLICPQDTKSGQYLKELGAKTQVFGPEISLKSLYQRSALTKSGQDRQSCWLAASTHEGEDETLLQAHLEILKTAPQMRLILAPRHPKRGPNIMRLAQALGLSVARRSAGDIFGKEQQVYIADTLGEMDQWYSAAGTCFVGGSLVRKGGHTPFEPLAFECAILHGPHLENFVEAYQTLHAQNGACLCSTAQEVAAAALNLADPENAQSNRQNARNALAQTDTLDVVLTALSQLSKN